MKIGKSLFAAIPALEGTESKLIRKSERFLNFHIASYQGRTLLQLGLTENFSVPDILGQQLPVAYQIALNNLTKLLGKLNLIVNDKNYVVIGNDIEYAHVQVPNDPIFTEYDARQNSHLIVELVNLNDHRLEKLKQQLKKIGLTERVSAYPIVEILEEIPAEAAPPLF